MATSQMFGYFNGQYYMIDESANIVVPEDANYKKSGIQVSKNLNNVYDVDMYLYHSDLTTEENGERVAFMKEFIVNEKVPQIIHVNNEFLISAEYELFNKDGKCLSNGVLSTRAESCNGVILAPVDQFNHMMYRKLYVFDGRIEIPVPNISRYGIKCQYNQHPYTIRINSIKVTTTYGNDTYMIGKDEQVVRGKDIDGKYHSAKYTLYHHMCDCPNEITHNNYASKFLTNATIGTSIIDSMVGPAVLEAPADYTEVVVANIPCATQDNSYTVKIDGKADQIVLNVEAIVDNFNTVYDVADIEALLATVNGSGAGKDDSSTDTDTGNTGNNCTFGGNCGCCTKKDDSTVTPPTGDKKDPETPPTEDKKDPVVPPTDTDQKGDQGTTENPGDNKDQNTEGSTDTSEDKG
jgi:hypothetical protein